MKGVSVIKIYILIVIIVLPYYCTSCTLHTYHFGVADQAEPVPEVFAATENTIANSEQSEGAKYCPEKISRAKQLAHDGAVAYWANKNLEASRLLEEARKLAIEVKGCGPAPGPVKNFV